MQSYIHLFGGDKDKVTIFGESAGGGSVLHQITAFGGNGGAVPFQRAIAQSPAWQVIESANQQEKIFQNFLAAAGVKTLAEARALPYEQVQAANQATVGNATYGTFTYGPVVDGVFTPSIPGALLKRAQFHTDVEVMVGQNQDEGLLFTSPFLINDDANDTRLREMILISAPTLKGLPDQVDYILNTLYPAANYSNQVARGAQITADFAIICNARYLDTAFKNKTYAYEFDIFPALHGEDVPYTYYTGVGQSVSGVTSPQTALAMQDYFTSFAETGTPNQQGDGTPFFHMYSNNATVELLQSSSITEAMDPAANMRCDYWQSGVWY